MTCTSSPHLDMSELGPVSTTISYPSEEDFMDAPVAFLPSEALSHPPRILFL